LPPATNSRDSLGRRFTCASVPKAVVDSYHAAIVKVMADPEVKEKFAGLGVLARSSSQDEFRSFLATETAKYAKLIADNGIKAEQ
jgi:tripartite-type tricarboxylate transporter receptor subunit TctC